jgi:predicted GIY-YIG superfamily endonuclease
MIYVLLLEHGKIYVGYTERENGERFIEHFDGNGSKWTQKYKPIEVIEFRKGTLEDERIVTLEYMKAYGWYNVRGSCYCQVEMTTPPKELMPNMPSKITKSTNKIKIHHHNADICFRCNRPGHWSNNCYAKTDINNHPIFDDYDDSSSDDDVCFRCGRSGHWSSECYAKTDISGRYI